MRTRLGEAELDALRELRIGHGPVPAFYNRPRTIDELVDHTVTRVLDQFGIHLDLIRRWEGI